MHFVNILPTIPYLVSAKNVQKSSSILFRLAALVDQLSPTKANELAMSTAS